MEAAWAIRLELQGPAWALIAGYVGACGMEAAGAKTGEGWRAAGAGP